MKYNIPNEDKLLINSAFPENWEFTGDDNIFNDFMVQHYDFDYDSVFQSLFSKSLSGYLSDKDKVSQPFLIYNYIYNTDTPNYICPKDQPYNVLGLDAKKEFTHGELSKVEYMGKDSDGNYTVLVVRETNTYNRGADGYIKDRVKLIEWFVEDGSVGDTKTTTKSYTTMEAAAAGKRMRDNVIEELKPNLIGFLMQESGVGPVTAQQRGFELLINYQDSITAFIEGMKQVLIDGISNDSTIDWLDNDILGSTPRQFILSYIDFDVE